LLFERFWLFVDLEMRSCLKVFLVLLAFNSSTAHAQWSVFFDNYIQRDSMQQVYDQAKDFTQLDDGTYLFSAISSKLGEVDTLGFATTYLTYWNVDANGHLSKLSTYRKKNFSVNTVWVESFGDSSYLFIGQVFDLVRYYNDTIGAMLYLVKVNGQGDTLWTKTISWSDGDEYPTQLIKTRDGGFAIVGQSCDKLETNCDMFLLKLDSNANEEWHRTYAWDEQSWELPNSMHETSSGEFLLTSMMFPIGTRNFYGFVLKVDANGELLWKLRPDKQNNQYSTIQDVVEDPLTGQYYFCGAIGESEIKPYHYQGWLIKTDTSGIILKEKKIGESTKETYFHKMLFDRGHLVLNGESNNFPGFIENLRPLLYKTDSNFNIHFARAITDSLNPTQTYITYNLKPTADGGFGMIGFGDDPKRAGNNQDVWFLKVDSNGCLYQPCLSVGLEQQAPNEEIKVTIFPQPVKEKFQIETAFDYDQIELVHMNGVSIGIWGRQEVYLLPAIPTGVYLLRLSNKFGTKLSRKILVQEN
jgi:hypothetical protein